jgi:chemotaxis protein methyltransferase CheR
MDSAKGNVPEGLVMKEEELTLLKDLISKEFGIVIKGDKRLSLHRKLSHRLSTLGLTSYRDYYNLIVSEASREELFTLVSCTTNNETYFQRELGQADVFLSMLGDIHRNKRRKGQKKIRIICAGCSSGEEVYTLNIMIRESGLFAWGWDVSLVGIDVNRISLGKAKNAAYTKNSFRMLKGNEEFSRKYFDKEKEKGLYVLKSPYRSHVHFVHGNLIDPRSFDGIESADIIFCRNVLIYMNNSAIKRVTENFYRTLQDDGYLCIGLSESLMKRTDLFFPENRHGVIVYRKTLHSSP